MPRIARICAVNYPHHITQRGNNRGTVFFNGEDREFYLRTLRAYGEKWDLDIWAYCLMENHVHILAVPRTEESLAKGMGGTNLVYTQYINRRYERSGRLWQNRFFSTTVDQEAYLWAVAIYIERNPVRANIVKRAEDYPWSSAKAHILRVADPVLSGEDWLEESHHHAYCELLKQEDRETEESIRKATSAGRPLGGKAFLEALERILEREVIPKRPGRQREKKQ